MVVRFPQKRAPFSSSSRKSSGETDSSSSSDEADPIRVIAGLKQCGHYVLIVYSPNKRPAYPTNRFPKRGVQNEHLVLEAGLVVGIFSSTAFK